jgi:hypothetical protein
LSQRPAGRKAGILHIPALNSTEVCLLDAGSHAQQAAASLKGFLRLGFPVGTAIHSHKRVAVLIFKHLMLLLLPGITSREAKHVYPLTAPQRLQKNLTAVFETHGIAVLIDCRTQLHKRHFFALTHVKSALEVLRDIPQTQAGSGRDANRESRFAGP